MRLRVIPSLIAFAETTRAAPEGLALGFAAYPHVEAVARELERSHGFTYISDEKLRASMSVGVEEEDTFLVEPSDEFRSMVVELERS